MSVADPTAFPPPEPLLRVMSLHALSYCERLFYLEEVEEIRRADEAVFPGPGSSVITVLGLFPQCGTSPQAGTSR